MSYILCLAIQGYQYKKEPLFRLFLDKKFLYEFNLKFKKNADDFPKKFSDNIYEHIFDKNYIINKNPLQNGNILQNIISLKKNILTSDLHYFFFELDKNQLYNSEKFVLEIFNNDSNFTNGFLTKSTRISIKLMYLIPKKILKDYKNFFKSWEDKIQEEKNSCKSLDDIKNFYKNKIVLQKNFFNLLDNNSIIFTNNGRTQNIVFRNFFLVYTGGYTKLTVPFVNNLNNNFNKDNLLYNDTGEHAITYLLCNKYKEYEDSGNNY